MNIPCPHCGNWLARVWQHGSIEMGRCPRCGEVPLATVYHSTADEVHVETDYEAIAVHDDSRDFYVRLSQLVPGLNVVQLKEREAVIDGRRVVPLGIQTNSISAPTFMDRVQELGLAVELRPASLEDDSP